MDNLASLLFLPIVSGVTLLIIEYWIIEPTRSKNQTNKPSETKIVNLAHPVVYQSNINAEDEFSILDAFYKLTIGILGGSGGLTSAIIIRLAAEDYYSPRNTDLLNGLADLVANSNFIFGIIALFTLVGGIVLAFLVDDGVTKKPVFWIRVFASGIFGIVGGFGILILLIIGAIVLFISTANKGEKQWRQLGDKNKDDVV